MKFVDDDDDDDFLKMYWQYQLNTSTNFFKKVLQYQYQYF